MKEKTRIGLIHATMNSVSPIIQAFSEMDTEVELVNFMDEGLIYELNETNKITNRMIMRLSELAGKAIESGVHAILFTCSSFTPYVAKIAEIMPVPVLSSDISMLIKAVNDSEHIAVIATVEAAGPTTTGILYDLGNKRGKSIKVDTFILPEAFQALQNGDASTHDRLIREKINEIKDSGSIVLAQYSMTRVIYSMEEPPSNILTGPQISAQAITAMAFEHHGKESKQ